MNPEAAVQIKEDGVRGRCRVAKACDVDWERVTHWRWDKQPDAGEAEPKQPEQMSYKECVAERQRIKAELTRMQAALSAAKRSQDNLAIDNWGHRIQALTQRASTASRATCASFANLRGALVNADADRNDRLLRMSEVTAMTGLSKAMIYRLISQQRFPAQYKPGGFASRWREVEIIAWRESQRKDSRPPNLAAADIKVTANMYASTRARDGTSLDRYAICPRRGVRNGRDAKR
jgi:prophage regulatory protein